jgi:hypothetical protein
VRGDILPPGTAPAASAAARTPAGQAALAAAQALAALSRCCFTASKIRLLPKGMIGRSERSAPDRDPNGRKDSLAGASLLGKPDFHHRGRI